MAEHREVTPEALAAWMRDFAARVAEHKDLLTELDSAIGDADHGTNMDRGMSAVVAALDDASTAPAPLLKTAGMTLVSTVGGASGPLYGTFFLRMATSAGDTGVLDARGFATAFRAGLDGVVQRGKADPGDKTMVDALGPAADALDGALTTGVAFTAALLAAAQAAERGRDSTTAMLARKGRASYLGERSIGHQDPGATSAALLVTAAADTLAGTAG